MEKITARRLVDTGNFGLPFHISKENGVVINDLPLITINPKPHHIRSGDRREREPVSFEGYVLAVSPLNGKLYLIPNDMMVIPDF